MFKDVNLEGVKGVLLDLDDTLYRYDLGHLPAKNAMIQSFMLHFGCSESSAIKSYDQARQRTHQQLPTQAAGHSRLLYAKYMVEQQSGHVNAEIILELEKVYWSTFLDKIQLEPQAIEFMDQCQSKNIPIVIVTDLTAQIQLQKFEKLQLGQWISGMITSEEAGEEKPSSKPFQLALNQFNLQANEVIMIGDSESKDGAGAQQLGIQWYHPWK